MWKNDYFLFFDYLIYIYIYEYIYIYINILRKRAWNMEIWMTISETVFIENLINMKLMYKESDDNWKRFICM